MLPGLSLCTPHAGGPFPSLGRELDPTSLTKSSNAANEDPTHPNKCFLKRGGGGNPLTSLQGFSQWLTPGEQKDLGNGPLHGIERQGCVTNITTLS